MALAFGTSGIRGLATEFTSAECYWLVNAFIDHLNLIGANSNHVLIAGDFRASTPDIMARIEASLRARGVQSTYCGILPTPALAYACITRKLPGIMVTGSHIPADRNGIKFYFDSGEILKKDEASIFSIYTRLKSERPNPELRLAALSPEDQAAKKSFIEHYLDLFPAGSFQGLRVLFYEHSTAAKEVLPQILQAQGAIVSRFGATQHFTPVDTEAVDNADELKAKMLEAKADILVSADGDGDRPMIIAENGELIPGDIIGLVSARHLGAHEIVVPVSCNTALEASGYFAEVYRTRIGSPFVLEKMIGVAQHGSTVAGFEANGGFFYAPLLTRDSILPILLVLAEMRKTGKPLSKIVGELPPRYTQSGLQRNTPVEKCQALLGILRDLSVGQAISPVLARFGDVTHVDQTDGLRFKLSSGSIIHFRPSGNAPEFRVYAEASTKAAARELCEAGLGWVRASV